MHVNSADALYRSIQVLYVVTYIKLNELVEHHLDPKIWNLNNRQVNYALMYTSIKKNY